MSQHSRTPRPQVSGSRCSWTMARPIAAAFTVGLTLVGMTALSPGADAAVTTSGVAAGASRLAAATAAAPIAPAVAGPSAAPRPVVKQTFTGLKPFDLQVLDAINSRRAAQQLAPLVEAKGLDQLSASWSTAMSGAAGLSHDADAWDDLPTSGAAARTEFGENVASWTDDSVTPANVVDRYLGNASNAANINDPTLKYVGINTTTVGGTDWNTVTFVDAVDAGNAYDPALRSTPAGQLTSAAVTGATVRVTGWGLEPDAPASAVTVRITDTAPDGTVSTSTTAANIAGTDIPADFVAAGAQHDFAAVGSIAGRGVHQVCAQLLNTGAGTNTDLGCLPVQVGGLVGNLDDVSVAGTTVSVSGWSVDYDKPQAPTTVSITDNGPAGARTTTVQAGQADARVDSAIPGVGALHGFDADVTVTGAGTHSVCATQISVADSSSTRSLGCRTVTVVAPSGALSTITNTVNSISVSGWALDPANASAAPSVELKLSGPGGVVGAPMTVSANASANASMAAYPTGAANHGFAATWRVPALGAYQVCATIRSTTGAGTTTDLGCQPVVVSGLLGWLDTFVVSKGSIAVRGWSMDSLNRTATATPTITVTSTSGSRVTVQTKADKLRADVGRAFPGAGNYHGYTTSIATGSGAKKVCMNMKAMSNSTTRQVRCVNVIVP